MGKFLLQNSALHFVQHAISVKMGHFSKLCHSHPSSRPPSNDKRQSCKDFYEVTQLDGNDGDLFTYGTDVVYFHFSPESSDCKEVTFDEINCQHSRLICQLNVSKSNVCTDINFKLDRHASGNLLPYKYFKHLCPSASIKSLCISVDMNATLSAYNKSTIKQLGLCYFDVHFNSATEQCRFFIVDDSFKALLGLPDLLCLRLINMHDCAQFHWFCS